MWQPLVWAARLYSPRQQQRYVQVALMALFEINNLMLLPDQLGLSLFKGKLRVGPAYQCRGAFGGSRCF